MLKGLLLVKRSLRRKSPGSDFVQNNSSVVAPEALGFDVTLARQAPERICRWMPVISNLTRIAECRRDNYRKLARALSGHRGFSPLIPTLPESCSALCLSALRRGSRRQVSTAEEPWLASFSLKLAVAGNAYH